MSFWNKLFGITPVGGVAEAATSAAGKVADIVERWKPSDAAKHEMHIEISKLVQSAQAEARAYDPRSQGGGAFGEIVNVITDSASRLIRPGVTILLIGGIFGWWGIATKSIDPLVLGWGEMIIGFWFGTRVLFKDIPSLIAAVKASRS